MEPRRAGRPSGACREAPGVHEGRVERRRRDGELGASRPAKAGRAAWVLPRHRRAGVSGGRHGRRPGADTVPRKQNRLVRPPHHHRLPLPARQPPTRRREEASRSVCRPAGRNTRHLPFHAPGRHPRLEMPEGEMARPAHRLHLHQQESRVLQRDMGRARAGLSLHKGARRLSGRNRRANPRPRRPAQGHDTQVHRDRQLGMRGHELDGRHGGVVRARLRLQPRPVARHARRRRRRRPWACPGRNTSPAPTSTRG